MEMPMANNGLALALASTQQATDLTQLNDFTFKSSHRTNPHAPPKTASCLVPIYCPPSLSLSEKCIKKALPT